MTVYDKTQTLELLGDMEKMRFNYLDLIKEAENRGDYTKVIYWNTRLSDLEQDIKQLQDFMN